MRSQPTQMNTVKLDVLCRTSFFFSSRRRHTRFDCDWSSDVCSSDLPAGIALGSSLGATVNVVFHLRDLDARVGAILGGTEWRAFAVSLLVSGAAAAAGLETARIAAGWGAFAAALFALVIFGAVYFGGTIALRHPDARRLWTFLR